MTHSRKSQAVALAALILTGLSAASIAQAAPAASPMHGKKMAAKTVYICKDCHAYYSPATAKKLNYKDDMGHTLVKAASAPAGYMNADTVKM